MYIFSNPGNLVNFTQLNWEHEISLPTSPIEAAEYLHHTLITIFLLESAAIYCSASLILQKLQGEDAIYQQLSLRTIRFSAVAIIDACTILIHRVIFNAETQALYPLRLDALPASTLDNLSRLTAKPGVQSTLILSKTDGSIIRTTGLLADPSSPPGLSSSRPASSSDGAAAITTTDTASSHADGTHAEAYYEVIDANDENNNEKRAEDVAKMVFSFVSSAGGLVQGMDKGDELKLLRMRTRK
ncbi:hypothetical protein MMC31_007117, partial [Peltigera leucophlebia]|nr:hypothetical protein [Peltigera leucophlebia]